MNNRTIVTMAAGLVWVAALPFAALAQDAGILAQQQSMPQADTSTVQSTGTGGGRHHHGGGLEAIQGSLTPDQQDQISKIKEEVKEQTAPLRQQMMELRSKLQADPQGQDAADLKQQLSGLRDQMRGQMKAGHEKIMAVLTDKQKAQLKAAHRQRAQGAVPSENQADDDSSK